MARLRRKLLWLFAILALLFMSLAGIVGFLYRDEPPPADGDLTTYRRVVPDMANGFAAIDLGMDDVLWPEEDQHLHGLSKTFDLEAARKVIAENEAVLLKLEESLVFPDFQVPEVTDVESTLFHVPAWRYIAYLLSCRGRVLLEEGKEREAFAECLKLVRFGHRIQEAQGGVFHYMVGLGWQSFGLENLAGLARRTRLAAEDLKPIIEELGRLPPSRDGLRDACRAEYVFFSTILDQRQGLELLDLRNSLPTAIERVGFVHRYLFQPNRMRRLLAEHARTLIAAVSRSHARAKPLGVTTSFSFSDPGCAGQILMEGTLRRLGSCLLQLRMTDFEHSAMRTLLALEAFNAANGRLPASLDELVPAYLESVPLDPFDGKPLRYSAEKKTVHSVGEDLVDSGGSSEEDGRAVHDRLEPTLRIEAAP
jgi:hypothetical protein